MLAAAGDSFRLVGTVLERKYRVDRRVAEGGFGVVYAGHHLGLDVPVAVKVLKPSEDASAGLASFLEEARLLAKLRHPCIVAALDSGLTYVEALGRDVPWIVLEWVDGETLRDDLSRRRATGSRGRSRVECMDLLRPVLEAIAAVHEAGIVHRDLKPNNVMLAPGGKGNVTARVLDFGVAKLMRREESEAIPTGDTATGTRGSAFTRESAAPEQLSGARTGPWTDVFALALLLVEVLTDRAPWGTTDANEHYRAVFAPERPTPARLGVDVGAWEAIVARALSVRPADRPPSARALLEELDGALATASRDAPQGGVATSDSVLPDSGFAATERRADDAAPETTARARRNGAVLALAAIAGLAALSLGAFAIRSRDRGPSAVASPDVDAAAAARPGVFALASPPSQITRAGDCSGSPIFAEDGSIVFVRQESGASRLVRIDPATHEERALTSDPGGSASRPAPGEGGSVTYSFRPKGRAATEVRTVPLAGGASRSLERGDDPWFAGGFLFFLRGDDRAIRRRALDGSVDDVVFEAPSTSLFESLVVSRDARWIAATKGGLDTGRPAKPLCIGEVGSGRPLDCTSAGFTTGRRAAFSPDGRAVYLTRQDSIVRLELATLEATTVPVSPSATSLAIAKDGERMVMSTCRTVYEVFRGDGGATAPLAAAVGAVGSPAVGPRGELAFPVAAGGFTALAFAADGAASRRVLTTGERLITEAAFSPDGTRIAFHDGAAGGGIFVVEADGDRGPTRLTSDPADATPFWLDQEHVVYMHPEEGLAYGRVYVVSAVGGTPTPLPKVPGTLVGAVPSRGTLLLAYQNPSGDKLVEATRAGKVHDVALAGSPPDMRWETYTAASPGGRHLAWFSGGKAWRADLTTGKAAPVEIDAPRGAPISIQPDDEGRVTSSFRHSEGQLYEARGTFR